MKNQLFKDLKRRELFLKLEKRRLFLKSIIYNLSLSDEVRENAKLLLSQLPKNSSPTRIRNLCLFTGRSRGVIRKFRSSRIVFREFASKGLIMGVRKASNG
jgi:ribosomal protein S14